ncbi:hypothetical protein PSCN1_07290 [Pantoea stewartii]
MYFRELNDKNAFADWLVAGVIVFSYDLSANEKNKISYITVACLVLLARLIQHDKKIKMPVGVVK